MNDIQTKEDISTILEAFYDSLLSDSKISYIFTDVAKIELQEHLPHLTEFWTQNILGQGSYRKNVLQIHLDLNTKEKLTEAHFEIWLEHFFATIDRLFKGGKAELMKTRAQSIATVMLIKLAQPAG